MKLYHISQNESTGYDTYSDAVVAAETEDAARKIHPSQYWDKDDIDWTSYVWASKPENVDVSYIGEAKEGTEAGVICASFHAG